MSPPVLADIDGDHCVEIILSLKDVLGGGTGGVQIWDVSSASDNLLPWPTGRGNNLRNGQGIQSGNEIKVIRSKRGNMSNPKESAFIELYSIRGQLIGNQKMKSQNINSVIVLKAKNASTGVVVCKIAGGK